MNPQEYESTYKEVRPEKEIRDALEVTVSAACLLRRAAHKLGMSDNRERRNLAAALFIQADAMDNARRNTKLYLDILEATP